MKMQHNGAISLLSSYGDILATRIYRGIKHRNDIIDQWRKLYGKSFCKQMLQVAPFISLTFEKSDIANTPYYGNVRKAARHRRSPH